MTLFGMENKKYFGERTVAWGTMSGGIMGASRLEL